MKRGLLVPWLIGAILSSTNGAPAQSLKPASIQSEQAEVHSVVVDMPQTMSLSHASPETWDTLPASIQPDELTPVIGQGQQLAMR
jgi:hypothetical protein